jgi:hypothetical protein
MMTNRDLGFVKVSKEIGIGTVTRDVGPVVAAMA